MYVQAETFAGTYNFWQHVSLFEQQKMEHDTTHIGQFDEYTQITTSCIV